MNPSRIHRVSTVVVGALIVASAALSQPLSYRTITSSPSDTFTAVQIDEAGNVFYQRNAQTTWTIEEEETVLATKGSAAPWDATLTLTYVASGAARAGRIFLLGTVTGSGIDSSNDLFTWISNGSTVTQEGVTPAPGTGTDVFFTGPGMSSMRLSGGARLSMVSGLTGTDVVCTNLDPARNCEGIWTGSPGSPALAVRAGDPAPGFGAGYVLHQITADDSGSNHAPFNGRGRVAFLARVLEPGGTTFAAIYSAAVGSASLLAWEGGAAPGGGVYTALGAPTLSNVAGIGFAGAGGVYATLGGGLQAIAKVGDPAPGGGNFTGFGKPSMAGNYIVFKGTTTSAASRRIFFRYGGEAVTALASEGEGAPGTSATFEQFRTNPIVNACGQVAFLAELNLGGDVTTTNDEGIWFYDGLGAGVLVVREGDPAAPFGYALETITAVHFFDDGVSNDRAGVDDGGPMVLNNRSELVFSLEISSGHNVILVAATGPQCQFVFSSGLESGGTTDWTTTTGGRSDGSDGFGLW